jgi:hypothetical protein
MSDIARLQGLLQASSQRNAYHNKALAADYSPYASSRRRFNVAAAPATRKADEPSLLKALIHASKYKVPEPQLNQPLSPAVKVGIDQILARLNAIIPKEATSIEPSAQVKNTTHDLVNDLAVTNCKRLLTVRSNTVELKSVTNSLGISVPSPAMAGRFPVLSTSNLPKATDEEQSATASPARGTAMLNSIFKSVRVPEFRHKWMFWAEKGAQAAPKDKSAPETYATPKPLGEQIISVKEFYQHFNNIPVENLKLRDSIHLFHLGVKPVWEDPRNARGGAWYFKIPKDIAAQFWHEMCLLAVGDGLQGAIETKRASKFPSITFRFYSLTRHQPSTTTSAASRTLCAGTRCRLRSGTATRRTTRARRSC